jgi:hypothetical protein
MVNPAQCTVGQNVYNGGSSYCPCTSVNGVPTVGTGSQCTTCPYGVVADNSLNWVCAKSPQCGTGNSTTPCPTPLVTQDTWNWICAGIAALLTFLIIGRKDLESKKYVGIAIAGIVAIIVLFAVKVLLDNLIAILTGSILVAIFGGIVLWFLGPAILVIVATLMAIVGAIRGK